MSKPMNLGIAMAILGFLLTCCLCPLAANALIAIATSGGRPTDIVSLYGRFLSERVGTLPLSSYVSAFQISVSCLIGVVMLVIGVIAITQARKAN
jgi:hypothetical protein